MTHYDVVVLGAGPGGYVAAIRAAQLGLNTAVVEPKYWGGVCLNVGCIPSKALLRNAELAHIFTKEAKQFGISGEATFDYGVAFDRSRKVADGRVAGVHFLMKKNKITEIHGYGKFTDDQHPRGRPQRGRHRDGDVRQRHHRHRQQHPAGARHVAVGQRRHLRGADPVARAAGVDRHRRRGRDRHGVRLRAEELRRRRHHRRVPAARAAQRGRRGLQGDREAVQEARRQDPHRHQGRVDQRRRRRRSPSRSARTARPRSSRPTRCCRPSASRPTSRATGWRRPACSSPSARPSASTTTCAPTCRTSTRSATSPGCCSSRTWPRRRAWSRPKPSAAQRLCRSATTG